MHVLFDLDRNGKPKQNSYRSVLVDKKNRVFDLNRKGEFTEIEYQGDIEKREYYSRWIDRNKALDIRAKIHSSVAFVLSFKVQSLSVIKDSFDDYFEKTRKNAAINRDQQINRIEQLCKQKLIGLIRQDQKFKKVDEEDYVKAMFQCQLGCCKKRF